MADSVRIHDLAHMADLARRVHALHMHMPLHLRAGPVHACRQWHEHCPPQHDAWQPCMAQPSGAAHPTPQQGEGVSAWVGM